MKRSGFILFGCASILILSLTTPSMIAATTQWFPTSSDTCSYSLTYYVNLKNGITVSCSTFNLYWDSSGYYLLVASWLDATFPQYSPGLTSIETNTEVHIFHRYSEYSPTFLQRITRFATATRTIQPSYFGIRVFQQGGGASTDFFYCGNETIQESSYFTTLPTNNFLDYFNNTAGVGQLIYPSTCVMCKTEDQIIAYQQIGSSNLTYIANSAGKVTAFSFIQWPSFSNVTAAGWSVTAVESSSEIPAFSIVWLTVSLLVIGLIFIKFRYPKSH
ncbi:MAG: hypothetical protein LUQ65_01155 [Candidatus Helarchaeota archaeon]|nr:hypothetical protein [Candidatus Helarchaeota archaeon]